MHVLQQTSLKSVTLTQVQDGISWCGQALLKKSSVTSAKLPDSSEAPCNNSLQSIAKAASRGMYNTLQEFQASFHDAARRHRTIRKKLEAQG